METNVIYFEDLNQHPLLEKFWDEYFDKAVDYVFKEKNLAFVDAYYHNGIPAYVVLNDDGKKFGVIIELKLNTEALFLAPNGSAESQKDIDEYFTRGFRNVGCYPLKLNIALYTESYLNQFEKNKNKRMYIGKDINYLEIIKDKNSEEKLFIEYPNFEHINI